jgi:peptide deformylase
MAVRPILRLGDPRLREIAAPVVRFDTPELHELVRDMIDTMEAADGAGLAAVQIGVPQRVVIFGVDANPRYPRAEPVPFTVLVNPEITPLGEEREPGWEGCLSVPGMRGIVPRYTRIRYRGRDALGQAIDRTVEGFHARVVQHECDHLDGILYPQRIEDMRSFGFIEELIASGALPWAERSEKPREEAPAVPAGAAE